MFKKFSMGTLAVIMAVAFSAFTTPKKADAGMKTLDLYWYQVDLQTDAIPQNAVSFAHTSKANVTSPCPETQQQVDCIRGFINELNTSAGPIDTEGDDSKMTARP